MCYFTIFHGFCKCFFPFFYTRCTKVLGFSKSIPFENGLMMYMTEGKKRDEDSNQYNIDIDQVNSGELTCGVQYHPEREIS